MATPKISKAMTGVPDFSKEEIDQFPIEANCPYDWELLSARVPKY